MQRLKLDADQAEARAAALSERAAALDESNAALAAKLAAQEACLRTTEAEARRLSDDLDTLRRQATSKVLPGHMHADRELELEAQASRLAEQRDLMASKVRRPFSVLTPPAQRF